MASPPPPQPPPPPPPPLPPVAETLGATVGDRTGQPSQLRRQPGAAAPPPVHLQPGESSGNGPPAFAVPQPLGAMPAEAGDQRTDAAGQSSTGGAPCGSDLGSGAQQIAGVADRAACGTGGDSRVNGEASALPTWPAESAQVGAQSEGHAPFEVSDFPVPNPLGQQIQREGEFTAADIESDAPKPRADSQQSSQSNFSSGVESSGRSYSCSSGGSSYSDDQDHSHESHGSHHTDDDSEYDDSDGSGEDEDENENENENDDEEEEEEDDEDDEGEDVDENEESDEDEGSSGSGSEDDASASDGTGKSRHMRAASSSVESDERIDMGPGASSDEETEEESAGLAAASSLGSRVFASLFRRRRHRGESALSAASQASDVTTDSRASQRSDSAASSDLEAAHGEGNHTASSSESSGDDAQEGGGSGSDSGSSSESSGESGAESDSGVESGASDAVVDLERQPTKQKQRKRKSGKSGKSPAAVSHATRGAVIVVGCVMIFVALLQVRNMTVAVVEKVSPGFSSKWTLRFPSLPVPSLGLSMPSFGQGSSARGSGGTYSNVGYDFDPLLSKSKNISWASLRTRLRAHNASVTRGPGGRHVAVSKKVIKPAKSNKRRSFGCLREGCRGLEIEEMIDRGWSMRFKTCMVNGTRDYKDINYHLTVLMADTTNLNHLQQVRPELFEKIHNSYRGSTYITAFDGGDAIGGNKGQQLRIKMKYATKFGCKYNDLGIQPAQYRLYVKEECDDLLRLDSMDTGLTWLLKPEAGSQGQGITFHADAADIQDKRPEFFPCETRHKIPATSRALVQEYIERPLLLLKCKFDVRVYMLIASSTPWLVFYHEGYLRRSLWPYTANSKDRKVYLTNTHFQSMKSGFKLSDHIWPFDSFQQYLSEEGVTGGHYIDSMLNPYIRAVAQYVFHSAAHKIQPRPGSYQIMGLDFMIDDDFHVHFIEANGYPGFTWSINFDSRKMVEHLLDLVLEAHEHPGAFKLMRPGDRFGGWQLAHSEVADGLTGSSFNPCEEFLDNRALSAPLKHANELLSKISSAHKKATTAAFDDTSRFVPRIPGWRAIGGEKGDTFAVRSEFLARVHHPPGEGSCGAYRDLGIEPATARLYDEAECSALLGSAATGGGGVKGAFVLKQVEGEGAGDGLVYFAGVEDLQADSGLFPCKADQEVVWIAQRAVERPLKLDVNDLRLAERIQLTIDAEESAKERRKSAASVDEIKLINPDNVLYSELPAAQVRGEPLLVQYDLRAYMLVASIEPLMVFYHDGFLRSSRPVLVNDDYVSYRLGEHVITFESFQYYLAAKQITGPHYVASVLKPYLAKVMEYVFHSARHHLVPPNGTSQHFHHLFAFNFVLGKDFRVHLTGVSGDPTHRDLFPVDEIGEVSVEVQEVLKQVAKLRRELVLELAAAPAGFARMRYGDKYGTFSLVFSEMEEQRYNDRYNPCLWFGAGAAPFLTAKELKDVASLQNFSEKQRASHKREMDKYIKKRWASCKLRSSKEAKEACIKGEITYRYMVYVQKERIPYDPNFITDKIHELEGLHGPQLPQWKIEAAKNQRN